MPHANLPDSGLLPPGSHGGLKGLFETSTPIADLARGESRAEVEDEIIDAVQKEFGAGMLQNPTEEERRRVQDRILSLAGTAFRRRGGSPGPAAEEQLALELGRRILGMGFLDQLLPPARTDLSEIIVYSSGLVQVMKKGSVRCETVDLHPDPREIERVLSRLLGQQNKSLNEVNPSVNAKLPSTPANPGGGRVKVLHPVIAPPGRNPAVNIRLFEPMPVHPEWIVERGVMSMDVMTDLRLALEGGLRLLITGGTRTGKTTLLSALCNFLPPAWRIVKIEDPVEIWIDRGTVQSIEARPRAIGTDVKEYTLADGVDDAMRMSPDYLIVGEVRDGKAALALFRAMMTGHSGACTFHADSPREAARRLATVLGADAGVRSHEAAQMTADAVDVLVQLNIIDERRVVTSIVNVVKELRNGDVWFEPVWKRKPEGGWERVGNLAFPGGQAEREER
jgi:pilus assembly protein CpaF